MKILPGSPQLRTNVPARPDAPAQQRPADAPSQAKAQRADMAVSPHPAAVASAHRIERPMPAEAPRPAPRGSFVNLLV